MDWAVRGVREIDIVELRYVLRKHKRKKYRCGCGGCVETALGPQKLCPPGRDGDDERRRRRNTESREVLTRIRAWAETAVCLPESGLGEAIRYMTLRWTQLTRFLDDPRLPIDNNGAERAMRGPVVGRRNHYGSRSLRGTEVAAIFHSLLESATLVGINPAEYLRLATTAALAGDIIPLPHEVAARHAS